MVRRTWMFTLPSSLRPDLVEDRGKARTGFHVLVLLGLVRREEVGVVAVLEGNCPQPRARLGILNLLRDFLRDGYRVSSPAEGPIFDRASLGGSALAASTRACGAVPAARSFGLSSHS